MKKMRRLIPAFAMLLVAATMLSTASFAWFTISTTATVTGMQVSATADSSLLITDSATDSAKWLAANGTVDVTSQNANNANKNLVPATHDESFANNLKVVADPETVDPVTGEYDGDYTDSTTANYIDYIVYLGTTGEAMTDKTLTAEISVAMLTYVLHNAVTVDFYVNDVYGNKLNLAEAAKTATANANGTASVTVMSDVDIPVAVQVNANGVTEFTQACTKITMRVYFDGAATDAAGNYYVTNKTATTEDISFSVKFSAN